MPSDKISTTRISQPSTPQKSSENAVKTAEKKMPLLTLDPNKPKLSPLKVMGTRSPHKRGTTPPQSPPTPHKIELIEDSDCHRKLRSSTSSDSGSSSSSSTSSEEGLTVKNLECKTEECQFLYCKIFNAILKSCHFGAKIFFCFLNVDLTNDLSVKLIDKIYTYCLQ